MTELRLRRREILLGVGINSLVGACSPQQVDYEKTVHVRLEPSDHLRQVPADFLGLGYETTSVARNGYLSSLNTTHVRLVRELAETGVIRIGGDTSDIATWSSQGPAAPSLRYPVIDEASISALAGFLNVTGWKLIWGLNLAAGDANAAADEAVAVANVAGDRLLCFQIGNEPDLYGHNGHRPKSYSYGDYLQEFRSFANALSQRLPQVPLAGPDIASNLDWINAFARDEGKRVKLLTGHYYRANAGDAEANADMLLKPDERLSAITGRFAEASHASGVPYRLVELNSFSGGGKRNVSDTLESALWGLDLMYRVAMAGGSGVNWQTGLNQLGFVSWYSPIFEDDGQLVARPLYYAMLAFAKTAKGFLISTSQDKKDPHFESYATAEHDNEIRLVLINKDVVNSARVSVRVPDGFALTEHNTLIALPTRETKDMVSQLELVDAKPISLRIPPSSAVFLKFCRHA